MKSPPPIFYYEVVFIASRTFLQAMDRATHFQQVDDARDLNQGLHVQFNPRLHWCISV